MFWGKVCQQIEIAALTSMTHIPTEQSECQYGLN